ncbi:CD3324 family protein [Paenibacillus albus]|uniref:Mor transcription activator domain-containing protein n=1 Tax=Paenibacillus albus TaxID=2495582 RepID=A0A3Q8X1K3_9BACL|nr:CD3324 family protein [Paenibacillus albus]AZN38277.1 hypothetical protein EJC50_00245 [Paenibacillus albus]
MKYVNADILPDELLREVQKYMNGVMVYIPKPEGLRKGWGANSGGRAYIQQRNIEIRRMFAEGATVEQLTEQFFLSCDSIRKIVYTKVK